MRIVIVDDNPICSRPLSLLLRAAGHTAFCVDSGPDAVEAVRHYRPDLLVLDVQMPGLDGWAVLRELRTQASSRELPVIMYSGGGDSTEDEARRLGAQDYIAKGTGWDRLLSRIESHLPSLVRSAPACPA